MVEVLGTLSPGGYNLKEGGGNAKHSVESRQKMSNSHIGIPMDEETKQKISETVIGIPKSDEHKQNMRKPKEEKHKKNMRIPKSDGHKQRMSEARKGEKNHMFGKAGEKHHNSKRVYQYALDGTFINSFGSSGEAAWNLKKTGQNIRACASGKCKTAYGFKWSYTKLNE